MNSKNTEIIPSNTLFNKSKNTIHSYIEYSTKESKENPSTSLNNLIKAPINNENQKPKIQNKFLTDTDFEEICLETQIRNIQKLNKLEKDNKNLPYSEDQCYFWMLPEHNNESTKFHLWVDSSILMGTIASFSRVKYLYHGYTNLYRAILNIPKFSFCAFLLGSPFYFLSDGYQMQNRNDFSVMSSNEFFTKKLRERTDLYDSIDAILDLRQRYSLYEINQLKKEKQERNNDIIAENMEYFYKFSNNKI